MLLARCNSPPWTNIDENTVAQFGIGEAISTPLKRKR